MGQTSDMRHATALLSPERTWTSEWRPRASGALLRWGVFPLSSIMTRSTTARRGTSMDVTYSGRASVHHRMDTAASSARQFCFGASSKIGTAAAQTMCLSSAAAASSL